MDLQESPEDRAFRTQVATFVAERLPTEIRERVLEFKRVPRGDYVRWQRILCDHGWGAPGWPVPYGGAGWTARQRVIFEEECFAGGAPRQIPFGLSMVGPVLQAFGTEQQKAQFLPGILTLDDWWCQGFSEPGAGSDLASLTTHAEQRGDVYVINGRKIWTTFAQWATWMFCLVKAISFLLIDMNTSGIQVRPIRTLDQGTDVNEVLLDDVVVPLNGLVGAEHQGWSIAKFLLGQERANIAGIGMCKRLMRRLKDCARIELKHGRPLIEDARFRDRIASIEIELLSHEWSLMRMISLEQAGQPVATEASILKIRGSEIQQELGRLLMECAGPYVLPFVPKALEVNYAGRIPGGAHLNALAAQYFDLRKVSIYGGTSEIQKTLIARAALRI
jgi:alkylation response protein AidB-like acyl-CoA dehydrogenase